MILFKEIVKKNRKYDGNVFLVFTPLYLGAQLIIPTAEDIGSPGRLAHWMDHHKITITHLTPAMV